MFMFESKIQQGSKQSASSLMRMNIWLITVFCCLTTHTQVHAQQVTISSSGSIPPYVFAETGTGIQLDIIREALSIAGHDLKVVYLSNNRGLSFLKTKHVDGVLNAPAGAAEYYYSDSTIEYQNGVTALKQKALNISSISDLQSLRLVGFQNASNYFGSEFKAMSQANSSYDEVVNQLAQLKLLFGKRCDAVVMDHRIFNYYLNAHSDKKGFDQETIFYDVLPPSPRYVAFHNKALRESFNEGLKALKASGRHQEIIEYYKHIIGEPNTTKSSSD
ncbi:substrate-binding periplasmic protein [Alkalimarinus sediminis]|uniref:Transporter substrate-binding domain-containing protein n=1 Tax=Alkalimarinus sediminis TaxID=1632866 RepID=A0A9E8KHW6_9ALTE|nr:transporter substrate-binding domain-containing protein [Alkalimarinus sediminis]UZW73311.1 transporter substrate-binding domain-containing protein [Alkalimarinus sediminis]